MVPLMLPVTADPAVPPDAAGTTGGGGGGKRWDRKLEAALLAQ